MKTNSPTVRILQLTQANKQGLYPIVIRVQWNGCAEKRLGYAFTRKDWDARTCTVRSTYPNAKAINQVIQESFHAIQGRSLLLVGAGEPFSAKDVLNTDNNQVSDKLEVRGLLDSMFRHRDLTLGTQKNYEGTYSLLCQWIGSDSFRITDLDYDRCMAFGKWLERGGRKNQTIFFRLYSIGAIWKYAIERGWVDAGLYPYRIITPRKKYGTTNAKKKAVTEDLIYRIEQYVWDTNIKTKTIDIPLALYVLGYHMGGLALVDMSNLRKNQVKVVTKDKCHYYVIEGVKRQKTNHPVPVIVKSSPVVRMLMEHFLGDPDTGEWLFPICSRMLRNEEKEHYRVVASVGRQISYRLRRFTGLEDITYYSCRHTYATTYMSRPGANPVYLATMMGRSPAGIFSYVKSLTSVDDIIRERERMGL